jgi:hypothetical protein
LVTENNQQLNHDVEANALATCAMGIRVKTPPPRVLIISAASAYMNHAQHTTLPRRTASDKRYRVAKIANQTQYHRRKRITSAGGSHHKYVSKFAIKMQILHTNKEPPNFLKVLWQILPVRG